MASYSLAAWSGTKQVETDRDVNYPRVAGNTFEHEWALIRIDYSVK